MTKLYFLLAGCALVVGAWFYGADVADAKSRAQVAKQNLQIWQNMQNQIIQNKRKNHAIVYKTGVADIRRVLRDKYSVAE